MKRYRLLLAAAAIFFTTVAVLQPNDTTVFGKIILRVLGIILLVGLSYGVIILIRKGYIVDTLSTTWKTTEKIFSIGWGVTTILFALFLLTLWYTFGGFWAWWWNSGMFLPTLLAVIGVILFADCEWRKKINSGLMFLTGVFIVGTLAINALIGWWTGGEKAVTPAIAEAVTKPAPQPAIVATPEPPKPRIEKVEREVVGEYGVFTKAELPPMEKLIKLDIVYKTPRDRNDCLVAIVYDDALEGRVWRCKEIPPKGIVQKNVTRVGISSSRIERNTQVTVKITYVPPVS